METDVDDVILKVYQDVILMMQEIERMKNWKYQQVFYFEWNQVTLELKIFWLYRF